MFFPFHRKRRYLIYNNSETPDATSDPVRLRILKETPTQFAVIGKRLYPTAPDGYLVGGKEMPTCRYPFPRFFIRKDHKRIINYDPL